MKNVSPPPPCVSIEKPAKNLASLVKNESLEELSHTLIHQWTIRDRFKEVAAFGIKPIDRALFYGPPGNGKTMAAQMIARELGEGTQLFRVKCESLIQAHLGATEKNMAAVLDWIAGQGKAVVLFDECEAIFPSRAGSDGDSCSQTIVRAMQVFWQYLDRWETPQMFLLATNMVDQLDPALLSRLELKLEFGPPSPDQARKVVAYWAETFHAYGAAEWSAGLYAMIEDGQMPESFRELWQLISKAVRSHISNSGGGPK